MTLQPDPSLVISTIPGNSGNAASPTSIYKSESKVPLLAPESKYPDFNDMDVQKYPWKYIGYRVFSKWIASDQSFFLVRRFGALQARAILSLQDEIVQLETELDSLDTAYSRKDVPNFDNSSFREDKLQARVNLIPQIAQKLHFYNSFINEYSQFGSQESARLDDIRNVSKWLGKNNIRKEEAAFITHEHDLVAVLPKELSPLRKFLERSLVLRLPLLRRYFEKKPEDIENFDDIRVIEKGIPGTLTKTRWQNDRKVDKFCEALMAVIGLAMIVAPLWILERINHDHPTARLAVITGFIMVFFSGVTTATTAKTYQALSATAAYSAVLLVFMQLGSNS